MAMFFFHIVTAAGRIEDPEGSELASLADAQGVAVASAREMLADRIKHGQALGYEVVEIADSQGRVLETVCFRDVLNMND